MAASKKSDFLVVAAIDYGTTYSGYAFSFKSDPENIKTNQTWSNQLISLKTPTSVLVDPYRKFNSFGYEAESKYGELIEDEEDEGWALFRRFKMVLHNNPDLTGQVEVKDIGEKVKMPAKTIFAMAIRYLKEHILMTLNSGNSSVEIEASDVFFVLTVPAIWDDKGKLLMREAAYEAGIEADQLVLALESEAASIWCQTIPLMASGQECPIKVPGTKYMVIDLGGGTADITVHQSLRGGKIKELEKASGGDWGGTQVDRCFIHMITTVMGKEAMVRFIHECTGDLFDLIREFETTKRTIHPGSKGKISFKLPVSLREVSNEEKKRNSGKGSFFKTIGSSSYGKRVEVKGDKLRVDAELAVDMFQYSIKCMCKHIRDLLNQRHLMDLSTILLVGGFSECPLVQDAMRKNFSDKKLVFPFEGGLVVLKGAVLYGHRPTVVETRVARFTYGIKSLVDFNPDIHPKGKRQVVGKVPKCKDVFLKLVEVGQEITVGHTITESCMPASDSQVNVVYEIYISKDPNPEFVTDLTCSKLGQFQVKVPMAKSREDRAFERAIVFGDTEIMMRVKILKTGRSFTQYFSFL